MGPSAVKIDWEAAMEQRVAILETNVAHIQSDVAEIKVDIRRLDSKFDSLNKEVVDTRIALTASIDSVRSSLTANVDSVRGSVAALELRMEKSFNAMRLWAIGLHLASVAALLSVIARGFGWI